MFLDGALSCLTRLNLLLQRSDPIIYILYDVLFTTTCTLISRFIKPDIVKEYRNGNLSIAEIKLAVDDPNNHLTCDQLFVVFFFWQRTKQGNC